MAGTIKLSDVSPIPTTLPDCTVKLGDEVFEGVTLTDLKVIGTCYLNPQTEDMTQALALEAYAKINGREWQVIFALHPNNLRYITSGRWLGILEV
jgi:hypothetical protein